MINAGGNKFEVRNGDYSFSVDEEMKSCSCRLWELSGVPCVHAVAAIFYMHKSPEDYIPAWFRKDHYQVPYTQYLNPVDGMDTWPVDDLNKPLPPIPRRMPGRPKKKRQRAVHEPMVRGKKVTKHGIQMTCTNCGVKGHNKLSCDVEKKCEENEPKKKPKVTKKKSTTAAKKKSTAPKKKSNTVAKKKSTDGANSSNETVPCNDTHPNDTTNVSPGVTKDVGITTSKVVRFGDCTLITSGKTIDCAKASLKAARGRPKKQPSTSTVKQVTKKAPTVKQVTPTKKPPTVKQVTPRKRAPSERIMKKKLAKHVGGKGSSQDDCLVLDE